MNTYYRAIPSVDPASADAAMRLAGGWCHCDRVEVLERDGRPRIIAAADAPDWVRDRLFAPRAALSGLSLDRPRLMGILNVTPDSFSDGGAFDDIDAALAQARRLEADGADILDIGGESTRPGAAEIPVQTEITRTVPVIEAVRREGLAAPISIDTRKADVARAALEAGAEIINDVSAFRFDPHLESVAAERGAPVILMHSQGLPEHMQADPRYDDALLDVYDALEAAVGRAGAAGIPRAKILVDPGIGFGKRDPDNAALLRRISLFHTLGCGVLLGVSRKGYIGRMADIPVAADRDGASAALGLWAISQGVQVLRVHDIKAHRQMIALWEKMGAAGTEETGT